MLKIPNFIFNSKTKKFLKYINLTSNYKFFNLKENQINKKIWNTIFRKKLVLKLNNYSVKKKVSKPISKDTLNFKMILKIEDSFVNYNKQEKDFTNFELKNLTNNTVSLINFSFIKEIILNKVNKKRQFFIFLKEIINCLNKETKKMYISDNLFKNQLDVQPTKLFYLKDKELINLFFKKYLSFILIGSQIQFQKKHYVNNLFLPVMNPLITNFYVKNYLVKNLNLINENNISKNNLNDVYLSLNFNLKSWLVFSKNNYLNKFINDITISEWKSNNLVPTLKTSLNQKRFKSFLKGKNFINDKTLSHFKFYGTKKNINFNTSKFIWKNNNQRNEKNFSSSFFSLLPYNRNLLSLNSQTKFIIKQNKTSLSAKKHLFYLLMRLEDKIDLLTAVKSKKTNILVNLYVYLKNLIENKTQFANNKVLVNLEELLQIKKNGWQSLFKEQIKQLLTQKDLKNEKIVLSFAKKVLFTLQTLKNKNYFKAKKSAMTGTINKNLALVDNTNTPNNTFILETKLNLKNNQDKNLEKLNEKLVFKNAYMKIKEAKKALGLLINKNINVYFINALTLTKYSFNLQRRLNEKQERSPTLYLQNIDRDIINKYKYVGIYIKDLIRVCFIGMFLKKPNFIAKFIAFQLSKLPRNRKETQFIKFIIKIVKTFAAEREEITGLRIKFKGRVNRWRRTKSITGERGILPLHKFNTHIEYGTAHAVNRKGALGIRLWIRYNPHFIYNPKPWIKFSYTYLAKESLIRYIKYSQKQQSFMKQAKLLIEEQKLKRSNIIISPTFFTKEKINFKNKG